MQKHRSAIFKLSEEYFDKYIEHDFITATYCNIHDYNAHWNDVRFEEIDPFLKHTKLFKKKIIQAEPIDHYDEIAKEIILFELDDYINNADDYFYYAYFGSLFSEPEAIYEIFKEMPRKDKKDIQNIIKRMEKVPNQIIDWISSLKDVAEKDIVNAKLRVQFTIDVVDNFSKGKFVKQAKLIDPNNEKLLHAARNAEIAYEELSLWLKHNYMDIAIDNFRVGKERYLKNAEYYSGTKINPKEIYEWGYRELEAINKEMWELAKEIKPDATSLIEIRDYLNNDSRYIVEGAENFKEYLEGIIKQAIKDLNGKVFDIPLAARNCIVIMDDDTIDESPYYMGPSDDFEKPGRTYYPIVGRNKFTTWENMSTWYHESLPGHHMQIATQMLNKKTLSKFQREFGWNSGYGEGWALYSEKLMDELGYFDDPGYKMGYLMCQAMRAARLVVDVGLHLGYKDKNGEIWTFDSAVKFLEERAILDNRYAISEVKRYISWAGQAISYKIGEKVWLDCRQEAMDRLGNKFNLKKFHMYALNLGPMRLDMLKTELSKWNGK